MDDTQNLTIRLSLKTLKRARIVAAQKGTSISALVAQKIDELVGEDEAYDAARRHALRILDRGWHLGGRRVTRDALHDR